jgi:hypothetical protein
MNQNIIETIVFLVTFIALVPVLFSYSQAKLQTCPW